eukprot:m.47481 g.47481  ORF g.47481 m.47481 type:complete len:75 (-) comp7333_c0_seq1:27-251(-)
MGIELCSMECIGKKKKVQHHTYFALHVNRVLEKWPESYKRERHWHPIDEALQVCDRDAMLTAIRELKAKIQPSQ